MTDDTKNGPNAGPNGDKLNWRDTNGVETNDSQADGVDVVDANDAEAASDRSRAPSASRRKGTQHEDAVEGGVDGDGTAPDQRTPDDRERSDDHRGSNTPDSETTSPH